MQTELKRIRQLLTGILIVLLLRTVFPLTGATAGDGIKVETSKYKPLHVEVVNSSSNKIPVTIK
jgi:hypothetical protein